MTKHPSAALASDRRRAAGLAAGRCARGFSLVEMLVVLGIILVLTTFTVTMVQRSQRQAEITRLKSDFQAIGAALHQYNNDFKGYPMASYPIQPSQTQNASRIILAWALIGPGPAKGTAAQYSDGVDGPGFKAIEGGKSWDPYLQPEKFKMKQDAYSNWQFMDRFDNPIRYYPKRRTYNVTSVAATTIDGLVTDGRPTGGHPFGLFDIADGIDDYRLANGVVAADSLTKPVMQYRLGNRHFDKNGFTNLLRDKGEVLACTEPFVLASPGPKRTFPQIPSSMFNLQDEEKLQDALETQGFFRWGDIYNFDP